MVRLFKVREASSILSQVERKELYWRDGRLASILTMRLTFVIELSPILMRELLMTSSLPKKELSYRIRAVDLAFIETLLNVVNGFMGKLIVEKLELVPYGFRCSTIHQDFKNGLACCIAKKGDTLIVIFDPRSLLSALVEKGCFITGAYDYAQS